MSFKSRLAKLEEILLGGAGCPHCHDHYIAPICIYEEDSNGTRTVIAGTPQPCCPSCGRAASKGRNREIVLGSSLSRRESTVAELRLALEDLERKTIDRNPPESSAATNQENSQHEMLELRAILRRLDIPEPFPDCTDGCRYLAGTWALLIPLLGMTEPNRWHVPGQTIAAPSESWERFWADVLLEGRT
jgi:hypothetical protein